MIMKKIFTVFLLLSISLFSFAQINYGIYTISDCIEIEVNPDCYIVHFTFNGFEESQDEDGFYEVVLPDSPNLYNWNISGLPNLPLYSINLPISPYYEMEEFDYDIMEIQYEEIPIPDYYAPYQEILESEDPSNVEFQIDEAFYFGGMWDEYYNNNIEISEPFSYLGAKGFTLNISPFTYNPDEFTLSAITYMSLIIPIYNPLEDMQNLKKLRYCMDVFDLDDFIVVGDFNISPEYHILVPDEYLSEIGPFVEYKIACGYDVEVHSIYCGIGPYEVREIIREFYETADYVLLVGDIDCVPYSFGEDGNSNNPLTDLYYYSGLDKDYIEYGEFSPELFFGRWPVSYPSEIENLTYKTIQYETEMYGIEKKAALFSGDGNYENSFYSNSVKIMSKLSDAGISSNLYDGRNYSVSDLKSSLQTEMTNDLCFFIYNGHGFDSGAGPGTAFTSRSTVDHFSYWPTPPITMLFGCTMLYGVGSYSEEWIAQYMDAGGVASYASTVVSYLNYNNTLSKKLFDYLGTGSNYKIASWITNVESKYYSSAFFNKYPRLRQISKYNLMGDPSLAIYGRNNSSYFNMKSKSEYESTVADITMYPTISDNQIYVTSSTDTKYSIIIYSIGGAKMFEVSSGNDSFSVTSLKEGIYIAKFIFEDGREESRKFLVKH